MRVGVAAEVKILRPKDGIGGNAFWFSVILSSMYIRSYWRVGGPPQKAVPTKKELSKRAA
jgi:hypothetical protein